MDLLSLPASKDPSLSHANNAATKSPVHHCSQMFCAGDTCFPVIEDLKAGGWVIPEAASA